MLTVATTSATRTSSRWIPVQGPSPDTEANSSIPTTPDQASPVDRRRPEPQPVVTGRSWPVPVESAGTPPVHEDVGQSLVAEGRELIHARRFADAIRVLESAARLRPDDPEVLTLSAVAHAYRGKHRKQVRGWLARLSSEFGDRSPTWRAVGEVAMARFHFDPAQVALRTAVQLDPRDVEGWQALAAAYAGHGWFDEAQRCLDEAIRIDPVGNDAAGHDPIGFGHWQVGRAVNYWALTKTHVAAVAAAGLLVFGLLGLALALSSPMLIREIRVRRAPEPFQTLADLVWRDEHRLRLLNAITVSGVLLLWLALFTLAR